jgi:hypothetical protein
MPIKWRIEYCNDDQSEEEEIVDHRYTSNHDHALEKMFLADKQVKSLQISASYRRYTGRFGPATSTLERNWSSNNCYDD